MLATHCLKARIAALQQALERTPSIGNPTAAIQSVSLDSYAAVGPQAVTATVDRYWNTGFAVVRCAEAPTPKRLLDLAGALHLGEVFVPPLYRSGRPGTGAGGVSTLTVPAQRSGRGRHPSFESTGGQRLHVDGTLQPISVTTILLCETPAVSGGHTILFNALGAFAELFQVDPEAAVALTMPGCLVRQATYGGCADQTAGPAFAICDGLLVTRYSVDTPSRWEVADGIDEQALHRAVTFMEQASRPHYPY
ncbi:MAG: TauD/TfdA family dioxygenase [Egibacteraceae bacterium]